jgi:hypothetical protein
MDPDHLYRISFTRCTFENITDGIDYFSDTFNGGELYLEKIDHDLAPLLRIWHGHSLDVTDCPRFDDTLLDVMGSKDDGVFTCATFLEHLNIQNCPNFSVAALRRFVESRLDLPLNDDPSNPVTPRIQRIRFSGNVPSVSEVEQAWFDANVTDSD